MPGSWEKPLGGSSLSRLSLYYYQLEMPHSSCAMIADYVPQRDLYKLVRLPALSVCRRITSGRHSQCGTDALKQGLPEPGLESSVAVEYGT